MNIIATLTGLPDEAKSAIAVLVTAGLVWLFTFIFEKTGYDFSGYVGALVSVISGVIVTVLEKYLALIPTTLDGVVLAIIHVLVLALAGGMLFLLAQRKTARQLFAPTRALPLNVKGKQPK